MRLHHAYGIDIGTSMVKIYDERADKITKAHNLIAIRQGKSVCAIGNDAYQLLGRTPDDIEVYTPMSGGRISDVSMMEAVLHTMLEDCESRLGYSQTLFFSAPTDMTEIEKRAYQTIGHRGKLKRSQICLVDQPIADAIGFGIPLSRTGGSMIVNMGAQSTDISVIADSRIIISRMIPVGGHSINAAIVASVRRRNHFAISEKTAKRLKLSLTDLAGGTMEARKVAGIDTNSGLPRNGIVTTYTVTEAVRGEVQKVVDEIERLLKRIPPQIRGSIEEESVNICGGSTRIKGLPEYLNENLDSAVRISGYYDLHTITGMKEMMHHEQLHHWAMPQVH